MAAFAKESPGYNKHSLSLHGKPRFSDHKYRSQFLQIISDRVRAMLSAH